MIGILTRFLLENSFLYSRIYNYDKIKLLKKEDII